MAGKAVFPLSYKQTVTAINDYKHKVETGEYPKADWWHFCRERVKGDQKSAGQ